MDHIKRSACSSTCCGTNESPALTCTLTSLELQERKSTVLKSLKKKLLQKKELENGYAFQFPGTDEMLDELTEFIKTERACCSFFVFGLSIRGDQRDAWLELTGPKGPKTSLRRS